MKLPILTLSLLLAIGCLSSPGTALEIKDVTFTTENAGKVVFKHSSHMKKKNDKSPNVSCRSCHNENMKKNVRYTMADMEQGRSCGQCHNGKQAFALEQCTGCHKVKDVTIKVKETGPVIFRHSVHLKKQECSSCHNALFKTSGNPKVSMVEMEQGKSCGACHNGKKAFSISSCIGCHPVRDVVFTIKDAGQTTFSHASHIKMYGCSNCHTRYYPLGRTKAKVTMVEMEAGKSCGACHDGKIAFTVKENCATCHKVKSAAK
ncbi:cytochrome c3 family protein [Geobacter sp. SVR]|uniref:cytochrome c3 family protein n=1 Tax=Geobacter sp. SVR TaxID=2495594 RepID=UPI00143F027D|nr:cytochrome c3 family protein [Geobacter sp. SVR]BCS54396.1 hypothetical protein GSVR_27040 [Geobacter sp. SVR]GCF87435.1 hypothetical protein GSbR_40350 [Geobacter sp. SVR]